MASLFEDGNHNRQIQFVDTNGKRRTLRLGKVPLKTARSVKLRIEALNSAAIARVSLDQETAEWVGGLAAKMYAKLVAVGLVPKRTETEQVALAAFLDAYIGSRNDLKPTTIEHLKRARRNLVDFFGADKPLSSITAGDADEFRRHLLKSMGENTANRTCGRAKQFFRAAFRKKLIPESPFGDMQGVAVKPNRARDFFVTRAMADLVLAACPDNEWRLIFALCRFAGLRCPSEHVRLRWSDVDWAGNRMTLRCTKTEHHEGKEMRVIPIFPEVLPYLEKAFDDAEPGTEFVITSYRSASDNLRTQFERIIRKADLEPWPKLFQNLRATRETELAESYPLHVVCEWIGNSQTVAARHYLQVTEEHFKKAASTALQKALQHGAAQSGIERKAAPETPNSSAGFRSVPLDAAVLAPLPRLEPCDCELTPPRCGSFARIHGLADDSDRMRRYRGSRTTRGTSRDSDRHSGVATQSWC